jgi:hypothetical protein
MPKGILPSHDTGFIWVHIKTALESHLFPAHTTDGLEVMRENRNKLINQVLYHIFSRPTNDPMELLVPPIRLFHETKGPRLTLGIVVTNIIIVSRMLENMRWEPTLRVIV